MNRRIEIGLSAYLADGEELPTEPGIAGGVGGSPTMGRAIERFVWRNARKDGSTMTQIGVRTLCFVSRV
jgi:hypothetical protein